MQSFSVLAYNDTSSETIREKQLEFASQYEYHEGDFDNEHQLIFKRTLNFYIKFDVLFLIVRLNVYPHLL